MQHAGCRSLIRAMYRTNQLLLLAALLAAAALEAHSAGNVLVLYGHSSIKDTHSQFFASLRELEYTLDLQSVKSSDLKLKDYDNYLYDHLIIMAPKATSEFCQPLTSPTLATASTLVSLDGTCRIWRLCQSSTNRGVCRLWTRSCPHGWVRCLRHHPELGSRMRS